MAQHDQSIADQAGAAFRSDLNNALAALFSNSSGATAPSVTAPYMWWVDTTAGWLKQRNAADNAWINKMPLADAMSTVGSSLFSAADAAAARTAIGAVIGDDVQAYDADIPTTAASQVEMETGTEAALRSMSPLRVAQAIAALSSSTTPIDKIVQVVEGTPYTTYGSTAVTIPLDDTIPQSGEGAQWNSVTITPTSATNRLRIEAEFSVLMSSGASTATAALFQDSTADALAASAIYIPGGYQEPLRVSHEMAAGTTSATTFKVRAGMAAGTLYVNGDTGARKYGGVSAVRIRVTEIKG